ncbi:MAG: DUF5320 domain-containing protein [Methanosarcinaceae archaeon]
MGSGTGRGAGYCSGNDEPGYMNHTQVAANRRGGRRGGVRRGRRRFACRQF